MVLAASGNEPARNVSLEFPSTIVLTSEGGGLVWSDLDSPREHASPSMMMDAQERSGVCGSNRSSPRNGHVVVVDSSKLKFETCRDKYG